MSATPRCPLAWAMVTAEGRATILIDGRKLSNSVRNRLEALAEVGDAGRADRAAARAQIATTPCFSIPRTAAERVDRRSRTRAATVMRAASPIAKLKAVKNDAEIHGTRAAHLRDGAAVARFLAWFDREAPKGTLDEIARRRGAGELPARDRRC